ncbi:MAG: 3-phosphoshikimate 1-carboxyvinyltransferase, partial [Clostridiales bacterium]|nr:3-phosphoshikimate 1-carboxyvinyltransferase [Clostridiales bacterium]
PAGEVRIPPSKSVAHRALICAALAAGESEIINIGVSRDVQATLACLQALGVQASAAGEALRLTGAARGAPEKVNLNAGESGTTLRFLMPIAGLFAREARFFGEGRLLQRPFEEFFAALRENGVSCRHMGDKLLLEGRLQPGAYQLAGDVSSQFVSGLLLALPLLEGDSEIVLNPPLQSRGYVDLTLDVMKVFGVTAQNHEYGRFAVSGGQTYLPRAFAVEADYSNAAFFLVAGALGREVECLGLNPGSLQGDKAILNLLQAAGAQIYTGQNGGLCVKAEKLRALEIDVSDIPDLVPPLTALLCFAEGQSRLYNAARLRMKESDRLRALAVEFNNLGAKIREGEDYLLIEGARELPGGCTVEAHNDHRIAMALAVASIRCRENIRLLGAQSAAKSYPDFWQDFCRAARN